MREGEKLDILERRGIQNCKEDEVEHLPICMEPLLNLKEGREACAHALEKFVYLTFLKRNDKR